MPAEVPPPDRRGSSKQQDAVDTTAETAVQLRPPRSIIKSLRVIPVKPSVVQPLVEQRHYLHSMPASTRLCFGVYLEASLVGAVLFTSGARHSHRLIGAATPQQVATLARLWLSDDLPANSESRVVGVVLQYLRRHTDWKLVVSYSDPAAGHVGTVYQAAGWLYIGQGEETGYLDLGDGRLHHPRSVSGAYGTGSVRHLWATGVPARRIRLPPKHRYLYVLDPAWRWRLRHSPMPYPKNYDSKEG